MHQLGEPDDFEEQANSNTTGGELMDDECTDDVPTHKGSSGDIQIIVQSRLNIEPEEEIETREKRIEYIRQMFVRFSSVIDEQSEFLHKMKGRSHNREIIQKRIDEIKVLQNKLNEFSSEMTVDNFNSLKIADFINEIDNDLTEPVFYKGIKKVTRLDGNRLDGNKVLRPQMPKYIEAVFHNMRNSFDVSLHQVGALLDHKAKWEPKKKDTVPPATFIPTEEQMDAPGFDNPLLIGPPIDRGDPHLEEETLPLELVNGYSATAAGLVNSVNKVVPPPPMMLEGENYGSEEGSIVSSVEPPAATDEASISPGPTLMDSVEDVPLALDLPLAATVPFEDIPDDTLVPVPEDEVSGVVVGEPASVVDSVTGVVAVDTPTQVEELPFAEVVPVVSGGFTDKIRSVVSSIFGKPLRSMTAIAAALGLAATIPHLNPADASHVGNVEIKTTMSAAPSKSASQELSASMATSVEPKVVISDVSVENEQDVDSAKPAISIWDSVEGNLVVQNPELSPDELTQLTAEQTNKVLHDNHDVLVSKLEKSAFFKSKAFFADVKDMLEDAGGFNIPKEATSFWDIKNSPNLSVKAKNTLLEQGAACMLDSGEIGGFVGL